jgi:hypothetical protein
MAGMLLKQPAACVTVLKLWIRKCETAPVTLAVCFFPSVLMQKTRKSSANSHSVGFHQYLLKHPNFFKIVQQ